MVLVSCGATARMSGAEPAGPSGASAAEGAAESAFREGLRLMKEARYSEASRRFEESQSLEPASGTLIDLAHCHRQLGKTASAWLDYRRAIELAEATGKPAHAELARRESAKLEPVLSKLQVLIDGPISNVSEIVLDGQVLEPAAWASPIPVDPGPHHLSARFRQGEERRADIEAAPGKVSTLEFEVPQARAESDDGRAAKPALAVRSVPSPPVPMLREPQRRAAHPMPHAAKSAAPWVSVFAWSGAASTAVGAALFVSARVSYGAARDHCSKDNACSDPYFSDELAAADRGRIGMVITSAGISLLGAAAVLHFSLPAQAGTRAHVGAVVAPGQYVGTLTETF